MPKFYSPYTLIKLAIVLAFPASMKGQGIVNSSGSYIVADGSVFIICNNTGFTNNGTFNPGNSSFMFTGNASLTNSFIDGTSAPSFNNLTINKTAGGVQLNQNITVTGILDLVNGDSLFLNNYNLDLSTTGSISSEGSARRITGQNGGTITLQRLLNTPVAANPGNIGIEITSTTNLGNTIITRGHKQQGGASIYRYYDIIPTNNTGLNATIAFHYMEAELNAIPETDLGLFTSDDNAHWSLLGLDNLDMANNVVTKTGIDHFKRLTLADVGEPLAVNFLYLKASLFNNQTLLNWAVGLEQDNNRFEVERSADRKDFRKIGLIHSAGNTWVARQYHFVDSLPMPAINYYRVKQIDEDGKYSYSTTVKVDNQGGERFFITGYPNPVANIFTVKFSVDADRTCLIQLRDASGALVQTKYLKCVKGINQVQVDVSTQKKGIYLITINNGRSIQFVKM